MNFLQSSQIGDKESSETREHPKRLTQLTQRHDEQYKQHVLHLSQAFKLQFAQRLALD